MKTVRKSVFETNSSSTHSVTVGTAGVSGTYRRDTSIVPDEGVINLPKSPHYEELGNSPVDKASLLYEAATVLGHPEVVVEAIQEFTGAETVTSDFVPRKEVTTYDLSKSFEEHVGAVDDADLDDWYYLPSVAGAICDVTELGESSEYSDDDCKHFGQAKIIYEVLQDKEKIKDFIFCSKVRFYHTESYDG